MFFFFVAKVDLSAMSVEERIEYRRQQRKARMMDS